MVGNELGLLANRSRHATAVGGGRVWHWPSESLPGQAKAAFLFSEV